MPTLFVVVSKAKRSTRPFHWYQPVASHGPPFFVCHAPLWEFRAYAMLVEGPFFSVGRVTLAATP